MSKILRPSKQRKWSWYSRGNLQARAAIGGPIPHTGENIRAPAPLFMLGIQFSQPEALCLSLNHLFSPSSNTDFDFSVWYWPLLILGASVSHREHFKIQMPRPSPKFWFSFRDLVNQHMTLWELFYSFSYVLCIFYVPDSALGTGNTSVNKGDKNLYLYSLNILKR